MWESSTKSIFFPVPTYCLIHATFACLSSQGSQKHVLYFLAQYRGNENIQNSLLPVSELCAVLIKFFTFVPCYSTSVMTVIVRQTIPYAYAYKERVTRKSGEVFPHGLQVVTGHCGQIRVLTAEQGGEMSRRDEDR